MNKGRLEAFSDGVLAVIITIMVLEMKSPNGTSLAALRPVIPVLLNLRSEFRVYRHLLEQPSPLAARNSACERRNSVGQPASSILAVAGSIRDRLDGGNRFDSWAVAVYGIVLLLAAIAYFILTRALISLHGESSTLATSIGRDRKGKISIAIYAAAIPLAFAKPWDCRLLLRHRCDHVADAGPA